MKLFPFNLKIGATDEFSTAFANIGNKMDRLGKKARRLGNAMSVGLTLPLVGFGTLAVKRAAEFETLRVALETATGSAEEAQKTFAELQDFAATTPFQLEEVVNAFIKLKNRGMDPSREALIAYGNTAGAMGKSLDQMIEAVADASTFEFERLKEFGIKANQQGNKVTFTFRGIKTTVRKDAAEIEGYLKQIGMVDFAGGMDKQAATISGAFSNMQDAISNALDIVGTDIARSLDLNEKVRNFSNSITRLAEAFNKLPTPMKDFAINAGIAVALMGPLISGFGQIIIGMGVMVALAPQIAAGFALITAAAPWLLLAGLLAGIVALFVKLVKNVGGLKNALMLLPAVILDALVAPFRVFWALIDKIWSLFGSPPPILKKMASGSFTRNQAQAFHRENDANAAARARAAIQQTQDLNALQARALQGDKAAIEILFKNAPPGMRTDVKSETNANVTVEQGVSMEGAY